MELGSKSEWEGPLLGGFNMSASRIPGTPAMPRVSELLGNISTNISDQSLPFHGTSTMVTAVISLTVFIVGLVGNTLAIYVVVRYAKMKTVTNIYILNLAVADELYILGLPFLTTQNVLSYWPFGSFLCRVVMTADSLNQFTSIFCLTVMSIDRYLAVVQPLRSTRWRRPRVAKAVSAAVWAVSFVVVLPVVIFSNVQDTFHSCNMSWPEPRAVWSTAFILYTAVLGFFGPLLVICMCYLLIIVRVKSSGVRAGFTRRRRSERKVTRMVVVIVVVFVLCWLPFFIINIVNLIVILPENSLMVSVYFFSVILTYVNSCANPLLYGFLSDNFKQSFRKVLCVRKANGVEDGEPSAPRTEKTTMHDTFLSPRNNNLNGHAQNSQVWPCTPTPPPVTPVTTPSCTAEVSLHPAPSVAMESPELNI
ncbi:somatostatin receptor type 5 isoform X1 [Electrophorus electricus]|uniref:somatostatin receptor type 5 isoform X1 n=1 Tax=Electrophorus electricus TaxID=8005 RepID=UPI0015D071C6|nr:somatostatin receptor type 5 isoform X1 [Electrophorus electricus]XP_026888726.2 somatostatin receptor type 5 isoform X1 [Electrophorus electricus]XP_026888727.2 somatostatin receptor type 5 isoform X1 [Electrophorus electricus]